MANIISARVGLLIGACCFFGALTSTALNAQSVLQQQRALVLAKAQSAKAAARAAAFDARAATENNEAERARAQSAAIAARIQAAEADIEAAETRIILIERMRSEQRARLAAKQQPAVRLVAALQTMARRPPALAMVQPGSTTDLVHVRALMASMLPLVQARTAGLRGEIEKSKQLRLDAERALVILAAGQKTLAIQRGALVQLAATHRAKSNAFTSSAMVEQDRAIALGEKARDIVDLIDQIGTQSETRERLATLPGPLLRPARPGDAQMMPQQHKKSTGQAPAYRLPVTGTLVTGLGEVSRAGVRARGLTIATRDGALVVAPNGGRIVFAGAYRGYGRIVIIDHGRGWTTLLTNMAMLDVRVGDTVLQGGPIGRAGNDRPTITVELRKGSQPVDITPLIT